MADPCLAGGRGQRRDPAGHRGQRPGARQAARRPDGDAQLQPHPRAAARAARREVRLRPLRRGLRHHPRPLGAGDAQRDRRDARRPLRGGRPLRRLRPGDRPAADPGRGHRRRRRADHRLHRLQPADEVRDQRRAHLRAGVLLLHGQVHHARGDRAAERRVPAADRLRRRARLGCERPAAGGRWGAGDHAAALRRRADDRVLRRPPRPGDGAEFALGQSDPRRGGPAGPAGGSSTTTSSSAASAAGLAATGWRRRPTPSTSMASRSR